jgi:RNA polymerase sigma factor (sigma-70 family)
LESKEGIEVQPGVDQPYPVIATEPEAAHDKRECLFDAFMTTHLKRIVAVCRSVLRSDADVQDAVQETVAHCLPHLAQLAGEETASYVSAVARNVCRDELRRSTHRPLPMNLEGHVEDRPSPEATVVRRHMLHALWRHLSNNDRRLLAYRIAGYTCEETARALGLSTSSVTSGLSRAYRHAQRIDTAAHEADPLLVEAR